MINEKSLVIYKNRPALVSGFDGEKLNVTDLAGETYRVREKDVELLHPGPCALKDLQDAPAGNSRDAVREAWELLAGTSTSIKELAELCYGVFSPGTAWAVWELLKEGLFFTGSVKTIEARSKTAVEEDEKKLREKEREAGERSAFLERIKKLPPKKEFFIEELPPEDRQFLLDVEALALGKTGKSRTMRELGRGETREEAHKLLLETGAWTVWVNPHPERFGLGRESAKNAPLPPPDEDRLDLTNLEAYAIDSPWSDDPDDAVSLEGPDAEGRYCLWVHVADPAASVVPGSPSDIEAMGRGATLYLPEGPSRMLCPDALPLFALGFDRQTAARQTFSPALSFKITLNPEFGIGDFDIAPSMVRATRLTYAEADELIAASAGKDSKAGAAAKDPKAAAVLAALAGLAERSAERRLDTGAVIIKLPEAHIHVSLGQAENGLSASGSQVFIEPIGEYRSADMIRECMILAGEGAARWALQRRLPFPYISQEAGELPKTKLHGLAGAWQLRRCMRPRNLSTKPGVHWGLGLDEYTQVTSPLRRYTDLLCHQQIRACLGKGLYQGKKPLGEEEILYQIGAAEAAASAANGAERASRTHWTMAYLSGRKNSIWEGVVLDRKGNKGTVIIPALGFETQVSLRGNEEPNDVVNLGLLSVKIPTGEVFFSIS